MNKLPHIIYILSDEHRGQAMRHTGDVNLQTPSMDRMAKEGVSFTRAYSNCPICTPARGTIFSGRHAHSGPIAGFFDVYKAGSPSTATELKKNGYHTAYFGKWHCGTVRNQRPPAVKENPEDYPGTATRTPERHRAGFDDWFGFECTNAHFKSYYFNKDDINPTKIEEYQSDGLTNMAIDYINNYDGEKPLFLVLSVENPHFPIEAPEKWKRHNSETLVLRDNFESDDPSARQKLADYYAMIENLDWNIGRVQETLDNTKGFENTLSVYFSDHGEFMYSQGNGWGKEKPYEESISIPSIFKWRGKIPAQGNRDEMFSLVDMFSTTLGLINQDIPDYNQGTDFTNALLDKPFDEPEEVLIEMHNNPRWNLNMMDWRGIVTKEWKYAFHENGMELLFNIKEDPFEMNNLVESNPAKTAEMKGRLLKLLEKNREPYFDVIMNYTVTQEKEDIDVSK